MNDDLTLELIDLDKRNKIIWASVFIGVLLILFISWAVGDILIDSSAPILDPQKSDTFFLLTIGAITIVILYIKRSILVPAKLLELGKKKSDAKLLKYSDEDDRGRAFDKSVRLINRYMMLVWFLADIIVIIAFINYLFTGVFNTMLIYSIVGIYSLIINFPSKHVYKKMYNYIYA